LLLHNNQGANPLNPLTKKMKALTGKRNKTDDDIQAISDLEFETSLYWKDGIGVIMPSVCVEATIKNGAKSIKKGTAIQKFLTVDPLYIPLQYGENLTKEELKNNVDYKDVRLMKINNSSVLRTRPRFETWKIEFDINYEESLLAIEDIIQSLDFAGRYVGLCDSRPKYGQFSVKVEEVE
jgi:hypothetical protein